MFKFQSKIKRQIQILGLSLSKYRRYTVPDLAELFNVEELTIKRDLQELRSEGIEIHSTKKKGVCLNTPLEENQIKEIILHFIGFNFTQQSVDRSTTSLIKKYNLEALENIVLLQLSIDNHEMAEVKYWDENKSEYLKRQICPLLIFQNDGSWRVLCQDGEIIKQFLLEKISDVRLTGRHFKRISPAEFDDLFSNSWKSWIGNDRIAFKLYMSKQWADRIQHKVLLKNQRISTCDDGSVIFEAEVNSLSELAAWIVSRGQGIEVLHPSELKQAVITLAKETLSNYNKD